MYRRRTVGLDVVTVLLTLGPLIVHLFGASWAAAGYLVLAPVGFAALVSAFRGYELRSLGDGPAEFQAVARAGGFSALLLMALSYTAQVHVPRSLVFVGVPVAALAVMLVRYGHRRFLHRARSAGDAMKRTLVVGDAVDVSRVSRELMATPYHGYHVAGVCVPSVDRAPTVDGIPVVGAIADVPQVAMDRAIDVVVVAGPSLSGKALRRLSWALDRVGAQLVVVPDLVEVTGPRLTVRPTAGLSLLEVEVGVPRRRLLTKALMDRVVGTALLLVAAPIVGLAALAVRLTSPGAAFYRQTRVGVDGATFTMFKLRSMYVDADARKADLAARNEGAGVLFKMKRDPRVTPVGRFLRRYSIDELPQLLNVVRGDMSLVGPRPPLGDEVARYEDAAHRRLRVKPGLTGLWQVSGRSDLTWEEAMRLDLRYVDNWSVSMDTLILWKTARAVFGAAGAY
ncbi:sugar transferase [Actinotalea sp.]|uniref:sugar transferase n=1 Tax=Actinotalea sp. TaxID=1872145 RepID=UPI0035625B6A